MEMDTAEDCKDPLHNLHTHAETTHLPNGHDGAHSIIQDGDHPQLRFCSTSCVCMFIGVTIAVGSIAMTACSYFADVLARETIFVGNVTEIVVDENLRYRIAKFRTFGPILIGLGIFFMLCACVLLCEARDRLNKATESEEEKILPCEYHNVDSYYKTAESIKAETLAITPDIEFPIPCSSSPDSESSTSITDDPNNMHRCGRYDRPVFERRGSPVVLVHGVTCNSFDDLGSRSSLEVIDRTDSLKRSKDNESSPDSSPTKVLNLQDSPVRKLPKLKLPPPPPLSKTPQLLELSPSKLPSTNIFPKPVLVKPIRLPPLLHQQSGNGPLIGIQPKMNQMLQTDFPSPSSSCNPSPVRAPRKSDINTHPIDFMLLRNLSQHSSEDQRTLDNNQSPLHKPHGVKHFDKVNHDTQSQGVNVSPDDEMETCIDTPGSDNGIVHENKPLFLCNMSPAAATNDDVIQNDRQLEGASTDNQNGRQNGGSLPESEHDSSLRDTNSNITDSTASVHSRNSNQSPNKAMSVSKREVVLV